jgi:hypothetical protein
MVWIVTIYGHFEIPLSYRVTSAKDVTSSYIKYNVHTRSTKTIRISVETHQDLAKLGTLADSFDTVIQELLIVYRKKGGMITKE